MWIIAGANGAGKSTLTNKLLKALITENLIKLNADERAIELRCGNPTAALDDLNLQAAIEIDKEVERHIKDGRSFIVETVLSSPKYRDDVTAAKAAGFRIGLVYISLYPPELSPQRVAERVTKGGHNVATAKAIERYHRSHCQLSWFAQQSDFLMVFDNSAENGRPELLASRVKGKSLKHRRGINPSVDAALAAAFPSKTAKLTFKNE